MARRYPWVEDYTPVNEPLTTARFSALYGHWFPHRRDDQSFCRALLIQCQAIKSAMRAVRQVTPGARLLQTEDGGRTYSTPRLAVQARFENARRWLTFDLLFGRVNRWHPLWDYLCRCGGLAPEALADLADQPCFPSLVGLNYYLTSDRFLDERRALYPRASHGGNGRTHYADVEAVRASAQGILGHRALLEEAWARYRRPVALTEVHLGAAADEQIGWVAEAWSAAVALRAQGVDVRAVTLWALLGSYDWDCLVTAERGHYEPGVFELTAGGLRETKLTAAIRRLSAGERLSANERPCWWRLPSRVNCGRRAAEPGHQLLAG